MDHVQAGMTAKTPKIKPVQDRQILPISYAMPLITARFSSPAASPFMPPSLLGMLFGKK